MSSAITTKIDPPFLIPYPAPSKYALDLSISGDLLGPHGVHGVPVVVQRAHAEVVLEYEVGLELNCCSKGRFLDN